MKYFGAIDQGTTSSRFIVFNSDGNIVEEYQKEIKQYLPNAISVEHDPIEIFESVKECILEVNQTRKLLLKIENPIFSQNTQLKLISVMIK